MLSYDHTMHGMHAVKQHFLMHTTGPQKGYSSREIKGWGPFYSLQESVNEGQPDKLHPRCLLGTRPWKQCRLRDLYQDRHGHGLWWDHNQSRRWLRKDYVWHLHDVSLDADNCKVLVNIKQQSPDIAQGVHDHLAKRLEEIGAGD